MILSASISQDEGNYAWYGTLELSEPASFQNIRIDDPITLELGGEVFSFIVDNKMLDRTGVGMPRFTVSVISPTARFAAPRATPLDRVWNTVQARDAAEEAVGEAIPWELIDWLIPAGRVAVYSASPLDVVRTIAEAAGGMVETLPNGSLRVRHRFPVAVPEWPTATVDHVLTDTADNLSCRESHMLRTRVNKVLVRGYLPTDTGFLSAEVDARVDGLNRGKTTFFSGDTAHLLVHAGSDISMAAPITSVGDILPGGVQSVNVTENVVFNGNKTAVLEKPAISIDSVIWQGNDLGTVWLGADRRTVSVSTSGVAIARVTYQSFAHSWSLTSPTSVAGQNTFPAHVRFTGTTEALPGTGEIFCQRGDGTFRGADISDPLLTTDDAKRSRGRAEIDAGESLQEVSLICLHRPGFMPGQLIEVHDALMGQSWRGKITGVSHNAQGARLITSLEVVRHVQSGS